MNRLKYLTTVGLFLVLTCPAYGDIVAYWNFNSFNVAATTLNADVGAGALTLSTFGGTITSPAGSSVNSYNSATNGNALGLVAAAGMAGNGTFITINVALANFVNPVLTFASQKTSTGFNANQVSYSTNGVSYTNIGLSYDPSTSFALHTYDFSSINELDNADDVYFRITFSGATNASGNNRIDNIQVNATAVPEPTSIVLITVAGGAAMGFRFVRRKSKVAKKSDRQ